MVMLIILKERLIYKPQVLAITLSLVIALGLFLQSLDLDFFLHNISLLSSIPNAFADHGEEIVLSLNDTSFARKSPEEGNQVKAIVNYATQDPMAVRDLVKGVMKVYSPNGTLLKTSSSPTPFPISNSYGTATLATTITDPTIESVTAKIVFTNSIKTETLSNELPVSVDLSEDKLSFTKSAIALSPTEEEQQQPAELKEVPAIQEKKQIKSIESIPQTITNPSTTTTTTPAPHIEKEVCNDGIDNDSDTLIDFSDEKCNPLQSQQQPILSQQQPILSQQGQTIVPTSEICDDDLDNDFDGRVDSRDEECSNITTSSSFPPPIQRQPVNDEQTGEEDGGKEQQSD